MHLDEEQVQRVAHRESVGAATAMADSHLANCAECRARISVASAEDATITELLRQLDRPARPVTVHEVIARAKTPDFRWVYRAASVLLVLGVGSVAWAAPNSTLRKAWHSVSQLFHHAAVVVPVPVSAAGGAPVLATPVRSGMSFPAGHRVIVVFRATQTTGVVRLSFTSGEDVVVRSSSDGPVYSSSGDTLTVSNRGAASDFDVEIPRIVQRAEIRINGVRVFQKVGARVTSRAASALTDVYILPLTYQPRSTP